MKFKHIFFAGPQDEIERVNPFRYGEDPVESILKQNPSSLKINIRELMKCDLLVTVNDWETNQDTCQLVNVARIAGIEVLHIQRFIEHVNQ
ncbi:MAG: hypothetical protein N4A41_15000 [Crocinitomicaceae bacterium]|jgi:hypothetical protein|nr:hypothetical protein [Crocinitomicaceae bacterium]